MKTGVTSSATTADAERCAVLARGYARAPVEAATQDATSMEATVRAVLDASQRCQSLSVCNFRLQCILNATSESFSVGLSHVFRRALSS